MVQVGQEHRLKIGEEEVKQSSPKTRQSSPSNSYLAHCKANKIFFCKGRKGMMPSPNKLDDCIEVDG